MRPKRAWHRTARPWRSATGSIVARIVLNTFGSLGDLHPYLAVGIGLRHRGHDVCIATADVYRKKIEGEGLEFASVGPQLGELEGKQEAIDKLWHPRRGAEFLLREYILPRLEQSYEELLPVAQRADLLLTHMVGYAGPIVAEALNLPWLSVALQPMAFMSRYDMPVLAPAPFLRHLRRLGPAVTSVLIGFGTRVTQPWADLIVQLRKKLGLPRSAGNPILGTPSPYGTLAMFSRHFAQPQADWPAKVTVTGFAYYDKHGEIPGQPADLVDRGLAAFLASGDAPLLFTLGSSAVMSPQNFFKESLRATERLGMRAVFLVGRDGRRQFPEKLPESIYVASYAPYSELMPMAKAIIHQGGIGTTAQVLRAGRPMLVVPWGYDQPDNADRIQRLGVGSMLPRSRYSAERAANALAQISRYDQRAVQLGRVIAAEDRVGVACDAVEGVMLSRNANRNRSLSG